MIPGLRWGWFELPPQQVVNNLHKFAIKKKTQRKRRMFNLKCNIAIYVLRVLNFSRLSLPQEQYAL
jgi:hypothetical protein